MTTAVAAPRVLYGHFATFDEWTTIDSYEGRFMERNAPGAFAQSMTERRNRIRALFDHGKDPTIGSKPLGAITELHEDSRGAYYEIPLLDVPYNREFIAPAVEAGLLGSSYRFMVNDNGDRWTQPVRRTAWNPDRLPERVIVSANVFEFGPVVFAQYEGATASLRGVTPTHAERLRYVRRAYASRNGIRPAPFANAPIGNPTSDRAEQLCIRARAVRLGRHNARTAGQRRASLELERALLADAATAIRGKRKSTQDTHIEIRNNGTVAVR